MQINLLVPEDAPTGSEVPIEVTVGTAQSPLGTTIAVN
jgi:uncharacterized protein (TIGR03437 family)